MPECAYIKLRDAIYAINDQDFACMRDSGYSFYGLHAVPTPDQITKICSSAGCQRVIKAIRDTQPTECNTGGTMYNYNIYAQILDPIKTRCDAMPPPTTAPPPTIPAPAAAATPATPPPTEAPAISSSAPSVSSGSSTVNATTSVAPPVASPQNSNSSSANTTSDRSTGMSSTLIIAIIAGGVMVLAFIAFVAFRAGRKKSTAPASPYVVMETDGDMCMNGMPDKHVAMPSTVTTGSSSSSAARISALASPNLAPPSDSVATGLWTDTAIQHARIPLEEVLVGDVLSKGAFGEVLRGSYNSEPVAIKRLLPDRRKDVKEIEAFLEEAKLLASLKHQRIVSLIGVAWDTLTDLCIVTEFMDGGDLRSLLTHANASGDPTGFDVNKVKIALHIIHALSYLHGLKPPVVHRDLKSKNILLTRDLDAKLTDFGVSRERADSTMTSNVGSSLWMAPEVMLGKRYDEKADIFSFGVVLSELDTQELPYSHAKEPGSDRKIHEMAMLNLVAAGHLTVTFTEGADPDMVVTGRACVAVDPKERPTANDLLRRMHQIYRSYRQV